MILVLEIEFTSALSRSDLETYGAKLKSQMTNIYKNTPGVSKEFKGITTRVIE